MNIATQDFVVKNQPIECIADLSYRMKLTIERASNNDSIFKGIVNPNGTFATAIDVQPFVYDLVDSSGIDIAFTTKYADYNGMRENINIKMVKDVVLNATTHFNKSQLTLVNKNLTFDEWFKFNNRQNFGFFEQFWQNSEPTTDTDWLAWGDNGRFYDDPFPHNFYTYGNMYDVIEGINYNNIRWKKSLMGAPIFLTLFHLHKDSGSYEISFTEILSKETGIGNYIGTTGNLYFGAGSYRNYRLDKYLTNEKLFRVNIIQPNYVGRDQRRIWYERVDDSCLKGEAFQLYWINRRGGIDSQLMEGKSYKSNSIKRENFTISKRKMGSGGYVGKPSDVLNRNILTTTKRSYTLYSGIIDEYEYAGIEDLMYSNSVWIWSNKEKRMMPVRVVDTNYDFKNFNNDKAFNFSVQLEDELSTNIL